MSLAVASPLAAYTAIVAVGFVVLGAAIAITRTRVARTPYRTPMLVVIFGALWLSTLAAMPWASALLVTLISLYGFKEFARSTGLYLEIAFVLVVYAAIVVLTFSVSRDAGQDVRFRL